ncbi:MAG: ABC transporter permease [Acidobacteriia bacterium]|nr:ABC transporter permease [Terriglobia bacterium]
MLRDLGHLREISWRAAHVWRRDFLVYRTTWWTNLLPPLLEPVLYLLAFGTGLGKLVGDVSDQGARVGYLTFIAPGLVAVAVMNWSFYETLYGSFVRMYYQKTFDAILATPLSLEDVLVGEILWGATKSLVAAGVMLGVISLFGVLSWPSSWWVLALAALGGFLFACLGMCFTALCPTIDTFNLPIFLFVFPMFLFSGTFFPVEMLPAWASRAVWALPLTHVASLIRAAALNRPAPHLGASLGYLGGVSAVLFVAALVLMRRRLIR